MLCTIWMCNGTGIWLLIMHFIRSWIMLLSSGQHYFLYQGQENQVSLYWHLLQVLSTVEQWRH